MAQFTAVDEKAVSMIDTTATPPWCMIPEQGVKIVRLTQDDGVTLRVAPGATTTLQLRETKSLGDRAIEIRAQNPGEATLQAVRDKAVVAMLDIAVFPHKQFTISFRFVYDKSGEVTGQPLSKLSYKELSDALSVVNNIYRPQVNLSVTELSAGPTHVSDDLSRGLVFRAGGISLPELKNLPAPLQVFRLKTNLEIGCVSGSIPGPLGCDPSGLGVVNDTNLRGRLQALDLEFNLFRRVDQNADFTFLLINKLVNAPDVGAFTIGDGCILPDTVPTTQRGFVMAHEFGHFLLGKRSDGKAWHTVDKRDLMSEVLASRPSEQGFFIRKTEALQMARKIPKPRS